MSRPTILITGAAVRLGKATAQALFARDCNLMLHYNQSASAAKALMDSFNQERANSCQIIQADLNNNNDLKQIVDMTVDIFGGLTHLVNNASIFYPVPILDSEPNTLNDFMKTNFFAPLKLAELAYPYLKRSRGSIVNLTDIYAEAGLTEHTSYVASKAALLGASQELAYKLAPEVRVNCVSPGAILWPSEDSSQVDILDKQITTDKQKHILENTALKHLGKPDNIAATVCYLALDAIYTTGSVIKVDGGRRWYI